VKGRKKTFSAFTTQFTYQIRNKYPISPWGPSAIFGQWFDCVSGGWSNIDRIVPMDDNYREISILIWFRAFSVVSAYSAVYDVWEYLNLRKIWAVLRDVRRQEKRAKQTVGRHDVQWATKVITHAFHKKYMEAGIMTFVTHCTFPVPKRRLHPIGLKMPQECNLRYPNRTDKYKHSEFKKFFLDCDKNFFFSMVSRLSGTVHIFFLEKYFVQNLIYHFVRCTWNSMFTSSNCC